MISLTIRTDNPEAELAILKDEVLIARLQWLADRQLAETIHLKLDSLLKQADLKLPLIDGLVIYEGPGSFTGLRIGFSVANALAYGLGIKIAGANGPDWQKAGIDLLTSGRGQDWAKPSYGSPPHITTPRK